MLNFTEKDVVDFLKHHKDNIFVIFDKIDQHLLNEIRHKHSYLFENIEMTFITSENIHIFKSLKMSTSSPIFNNIIYDKGMLQRVAGDEKNIFNFILKFTANDTSLEYANDILINQRASDGFHMIYQMLSNKEFFIAFMNKYKEFSLELMSLYQFNNDKNFKKDLSNMDKEYVLSYLLLFKNFFGYYDFDKIIEPYMTKEIFLNLIDHSGKDLISFVSKYDYSSEEKIKMIVHFELYNQFKIFKSIAPVEYLEFRKQLEVNTLLNVKINKKEKINMVNNIFKNMDIPSLEII